VTAPSFVSHVRLFARARELAGTSAVDLTLPHNARVADLRRQLADHFPTLAGLLPRCAIAVGGLYADDHHLVTPGAEVAVVPPVSGGASWSG
jgi:molybdopterin converting factor subunit 1